MSWKDNLLDASFRGVPLHVLGTEMAVARALAQHGMPYRDGDTVEDLGREARQISLRAFVWGDNYEAALQQLIAALDTSGAGELVHPVYGSITVHVARYRVVDAAEQPDAASVELELIEDEADPNFFGRTFTTTADAVGDAQQLSGLAALIAKGSAVLAQVRSYASAVRGVVARVVGVVAAVRGFIDGGWTGLIENTLGVPGISLQLAQLRSQVLGTLGGLADLSGSPHPTGDPMTVEGAANAMTAARAYIAAATPTDAAALLAGAALPRSIPGEDVLPAVAVRAWAVALNGARQGLTPSLVGDGSSTASGGSGSSDVAFTLPKGLPADAPTAMGLTLVAYLVTEQAMAVADAVTGVLESELDAPTLTPVDVDRLAGQARSLLESAIVLHRQLFTVEPALDVIEPLRQLAEVVQVTARAVILMRPPLIQRTVQSAGCLRLIAFRWYGDHTRAEELRRLNPTLRTPYALDAGQVLNAYAK